MYFVNGIILRFLPFTKVIFGDMDCASTLLSFWFHWKFFPFIVFYLEDFQVSTYLSYLKPFHEIELFSEEPSILFDLCKKLPSKLTGTQAKTPLSILAPLHLNTSQLKDSERDGGKEGRVENQSYQFLLKFKPPLVSHRSIHCFFTQLQVGLFCSAHISLVLCRPRACFLSFELWRALVRSVKSICPLITR